MRIWHEFGNFKRFNTISKNCWRRQNDFRNVIGKYTKSINGHKLYQVRGNTNLKYTVFKPIKQDEFASPKFVLSQKTEETSKLND